METPAEYVVDEPVDQAEQTEIQPDELETEQAEVQPDESVEDEGISEEHDMLVKISNAEKVCRERRADVESAKEELKFAKSAYEEAVDRLQKLARTAVNDEDRPLLKQNPVDDSESADDGWKYEEISVLWANDEIKGLGKSKQEALVNEVTTLGGLEVLRRCVGEDADHLCKLLPKGIGETMADEIENRHLEFVAKWSSTVEPASADDDVESDESETSVGIYEDDSDYEDFPGSAIGLSLDDL